MPRKADLNGESLVGLNLFGGQDFKWALKIGLNSLKSVGRERLAQKALRLDLISKILRIGKADKK